MLPKIALTLMLWLLIIGNLAGLVLGGLTTWLGYAIPNKLTKMGFRPEVVSILGLIVCVTSGAGLCALNYQSYYMLSVYGTCCAIYVIVLMFGFVPDAWFKSSDFGDGSIITDSAYFLSIFLLLLLMSSAFSLSYQIKSKEMRRASLPCTCGTGRRSGSHDIEPREIFMPAPPAPPPPPPPSGPPPPGPPQPPPSGVVLGTSGGSPTLILKTPPSRAGGNSSSAYYQHHHHQSQSSSADRLTAGHHHPQAHATHLPLHPQGSLPPLPSQSSNCLKTAYYTSSSSNHPSSGRSAPEVAALHAHRQSIPPDHHVSHHHSSHHSSGHHGGGWGTQEPNYGPALNRHHSLGHVMTGSSGYHVGRGDPGHHELLLNSAPSSGDHHMPGHHSSHHRLEIDLDYIPSPPPAPVGCPVPSNMAAIVAASSGKHLHHDPYSRSAIAAAVAAAQGQSHGQSSGQSTAAHKSIYLNQDHFVPASIVR